MAKLKEIKPESEDPPIAGGKSEIMILVLRLFSLFPLSLRTWLQSTMKSIFSRKF